MWQLSADRQTCASGNCRTGRTCTHHIVLWVSLGHTTSCTHHTENLCGRRRLRRCQLLADARWHTPLFGCPGPLRVLASCDEGALSTSRRRRSRTVCTGPAHDQECCFPCRHRTESFESNEQQAHDDSHTPAFARPALERGLANEDGNVSGNCRTGRTCTHHIVLWVSLGHTTSCTHHTENLCGRRRLRRCQLLADARWHTPLFTRRLLGRRQT